MNDLLTLEQAEDILYYCKNHKCSKNCLAHEHQLDVCYFFNFINSVVIATPKSLVELHRKNLLERKLDRI